MEHTHSKEFKSKIQNRRQIDLTVRLMLVIPMTVFVFSCHKIVEIDPPANSITTSQVFTDSSNATSAILGIYAKISGDGGTNFRLGTGVISAYVGTYSDELVTFGGGELYSCLLSADPQSSISGSINNFIWKPAYTYIYQANACIDGLERSTGISTKVRDHLIAEAKFLRAFLYFNLVNIFGDVPYITSINYIETAQQGRTPKSEIYVALISDMELVKDKFSFDYLNGVRSRASKWSVLALLSRLHLYTNNWAKADEYATAIINRSDVFSLNSDLSNVFIPDSRESILQWDKNKYNVIVEAFNFVKNTGTSPNYYLSNQLLGAFEANDQRRLAWVKSHVYLNNTYYLPYKYKVRISDVTGPTTESYTIFRLAEQFLIRAEARAQQNNLSGAVDDLNIIRTRAGLPNLPGTLTQSQVLEAVEQERKIELFAEWGHRWFDLNRTGKADELMSILAPLKNGGLPWQSFRKLWPIPPGEIIRNPFLTQNPGY